MKLLSVRKIKTLYFKLSYSFEKNNYVREFSIGKRAFIAFLGIPIYSTKLIFVPANDRDMIDVARG